MDELINLKISHPLKIIDFFPEISLNHKGKGHSYINIKKGTANIENQGAYIEN